MNNEFLENFIFEKEKENNFASASYFYRTLAMKYKIKNTQKELYSDLYKRIINYQVSKYGCSLNYREIFSREQNIQNAKKVYDMRKQMKKRKRKRNEEN